MTNGGSAVLLIDIAVFLTCAGITLLVVAGAYEYLIGGAYEKYKENKQRHNDKQRIS